PGVRAKRRHDLRERIRGAAVYQHKTFTGEERQDVAPAAIHYRHLVRQATNAAGCLLRVENTGGRPRGKHAESALQHIPAIQRHCHHSQISAIVPVLSPNASRSTPTFCSSVRWRFAIGVRSGSTICWPPSRILPLPPPTTMFGSG